MTHARSTALVRPVLGTLIVGVLLAVTTSLVLGAPAPDFPSGHPARQTTGTIPIAAKALTDHSCNTTEWHFVINQIDVEANAPASISVVWDNGAVENVPLEKYTGGVAHYTTFSHLDAHVTSATTVIYVGWGGEFNLSHGPCGAPATSTPPHTPTLVPTNTPEVTETAMGGVTEVPTNTPTTTSTTPEVTETAIGGVTEVPSNTPQVEVTETVVAGVTELPTEEQTTTVPTPTLESVVGGVTELPATGIMSSERERRSTTALLAAVIVATMLGIGWRIRSTTRPRRLP